MPPYGSDASGTLGHAHHLEGQGWRRCQLGTELNLLEAASGRAALLTPSSMLSSQ